MLSKYMAKRSRIPPIFPWMVVAWGPDKRLCRITILASSESEAIHHRRIQGYTIKTIYPCCGLCHRRTDLYEAICQACLDANTETPAKELASRAMSAMAKYNAKD